MRVTAVAQESGGATINGTVTDPSGALIAGAKITATQGHRRQRTTRLRAPACTVCPPWRPEPTT